MSFLQILTQRSTHGILLYNDSWEDTLWLLSSHLVLPAFYYHLIECKKAGVINTEIKSILHSIYQQNEARNTELIKESHWLGKLLDEHNIDFVFLKGAALLLGNYYSDNAERMIGDIDIIVSEQDYNRCLSLLLRKGFLPNKEYFFNSKHYPRLVHKEKIMALEVHNRLFSRKKHGKLLKSEEILTSKVNLGRGIYIPSAEHLLMHCIYNFQLNDYGYETLNFSLRSHYDTYRILKKSPVPLKNTFNLNKYTRRYYYFYHRYFNNGGSSSMADNRWTKFLFNLKQKNIGVRYALILVFKIKKQIRSFPKQIIKLLLNKNYRKYALQKIQPIIGKNGLKKYL